MDVTPATWLSALSLPSQYSLMPSQLFLYKNTIVVYTSESLTDVRDISTDKLYRGLIYNVSVLVNPHQLSPSFPFKETSQSQLHCCSSIVDDTYVTAGIYIATSICVQSVVVFEMRCDGHATGTPLRSGYAGPQRVRDSN